MDDAAHQHGIEELRRLAARAGASAGNPQPPALAFGVEAIDARLAGRGLPTGALHEAAAAASSLADETATTLFLAGVAARAGPPETSTLWALTRFDLYAPGLEQAGLPPGRVVFVEAGNDMEVQAVMEDALRGGAFGAVVGEVRRADMTSTRRLQLAAAERGVMALVLRKWRRDGRCPLDTHSAAATRWRIGCAPSAALGHAGVGRPRWTVELARQRNGPPFSALVEGCDAQGRLGPAAAPLDRAVATAGAAVIAA